MSKGVYNHKLNQGFQNGNKIRLGKKNSEEHRRKLSKNNAHYWLGKKRLNMIGDNNPAKRLEVRKKISKMKKGKKPYKMTNEIRIKMSKTHKRLETKPPINYKEKCWNWKGGITLEVMKIRNSLEIKLWRKANMERDNFTCQKCLIVGGKLQVHHLNNFADFPELRTSIENGITLCGKCHLEFHKIYGVKNNTKKQIYSFATE